MNARTCVCVVVQLDCRSRATVRASIVTRAVSHGDLITPFHADSHPAIAAIRKRVGWIVAYDVHVPKLIRDS